ncbi:MAG: L-threonylcarbamoyladenylate synthase [Bacteroidales bacterium]
MLLSIHPQNPQERLIAQLCQALQRDALIICPTDTAYALMCAVNSKKAYERMLLIKGVDKKKAVFSIIAPNLSVLANYIKVDNQAFAVLKRNLPGAFTFILPASKKLPDSILSKRKTIGIRIPQNNIALAIAHAMEAPILVSTIKPADDDRSIADPELLHDYYEKRVDIVIDGGMCGDELSTIVDCTTNEYEVLRQGKGILQ